MKDLKQILSGIESLELKLQEDISHLSTMRLKASGDVILIKEIKSLALVLKKLTEAQTIYRVLGLGSNQILPENTPTPYVKLSFPYDKDVLNSAQEEYLLPASIPLGTLTAHALKFGLKGWEVLTGIPATLGGAIYMNAGTELGEIGPIVKKVYLFDKNGREKIIDTSETEKYFAYRKNLFCQEGDVIAKAVIVHKGIDQQIPTIIRDYLLKRSQTQPLDKRTCGCVFKNYSISCRAGKFLDILNLKGLEWNGLRVSPVHANFIENVGGASKKDFETLVKMINEEVRLQFGIEFDLEVKMD